jgi:hypothetical protein
MKLTPMPMVLFMVPTFFLPVAAEFHSCALFGSAATIRMYAHLATS